MIKQVLALCTTMLVLITSCQSEIKFDDYFLKKSLRIDYDISGNSKSEQVFFHSLKKQALWSGNYKNMIDIFNYGNLRFKLYDKASNKLIYSKGFNSLFQEWQATPEAKKVNKSYYHVNIMPFPKKKAIYILEKRNKLGKFEELFKMEIDPTDYFILDESALKFKSSLIHGSHKPSEAVDIAFIAEGYTKDEMQKFRSDVKRMATYLFKVKPYDKYEEYFNFYAIESYSQESGTDIAGKHIYKNTIANTGFYTFDTERYLTTTDLKSLHDIAENVAYDQIFVLVNTKKYGGAGFYNYYNTCSSDNKYTEEVFSHEFGHGFVGLADEYYTSGVAFDEYYNTKIEPWEPNITSLVDFSTKWEDMLDKKTLIPTSREETNKDVLGVFEGGGYTSKGIYSPMQDCKMKSNNKKQLCPVCQRATERIILFHIGK